MLRAPGDGDGPQAVPTGQEVRLVTDLSQDERDRFDRLLAYVYKPGKSGVASVNRALVASGRAKVYVFEEPFRYLRAFEQAELAARRKDLGLWGPPCNGDTTQPQPRPAAPPPPPEQEPVPVEPEPAPAPPPAPAPANDYSPPLPPYPPDLDCADVDGPISVVGSDPHGLDRDGDGVACE